MKIGVDATYSVGRNLSGVGVYSREIVQHLAAAHPEVRFLLYYRPHRFLRSLRQPLPAACRRRLLLEFQPALRPNLFHGLNQRLPDIRLPRAVSTFHDLFVLTGDYSTPEFRRRFAAQAKEAAAASDLIIAVSEFTAGQVRDLLGVQASRLRVVPHGVRIPAFRPPPLSGRDKMILHVGAVQLRKNIIRLVEAFEAVAPEGWKLVLAGSDGYGAPEIHKRIAESRRLRDIVALGYTNADELQRLYSQARVFAFPSLDEGFGMPVLEAMAFGVPAIASNRSSLPEVAGNAALLVDPLRSDSIANALEKVIGDEDFSESLIERGIKRAAAFSWSAAAEKTWAVYQELV